MIFCKIESGKVVDRVIFDDEMPDDWPDIDQWTHHDIAQVGWSYADGNFAPPSVEPPPQLPVLDGWVQLRIERDRLLALTDWVVVRSMEASDPVPTAWSTYRQALRDLPEAITDPALVEWPVPPA